jgi:catalase
MSSKVLTTLNGAPVESFQDSLTAGPHGPQLLQDLFLLQKHQSFNRERIPERIVHAKGSGAFGTFTVTKDITAYTRAAVFGEVGKKTRMLARFSTVAGERGSADAARDPRGFALRFYTEAGNWDLVCNNTPVFFVKDGRKFPDFIHSQKRDPYTNMQSETRMWDFWSLTPESTHQVAILMTDRGTPLNHRMMDGFSSHTYSMINRDGELTWVKFHWKSQQGCHNFTDAEAEKMRGQDPDHAQRDLLEAIERKDFPRWTLLVQFMSVAQAHAFRWNPWDLTKVWPHAEFPEHEVGVMELNENPENYFATIEQAAFAPNNIVDGIGFSPDKMLQTRVIAYQDAHRYRLGSNADLLPVNQCPFATHGAVCPWARDGLMRTGDNFGRTENYFPNSFMHDTALDTHGPSPAPSHKHVHHAPPLPPVQLDGTEAMYYNRNEGPGDEDHFSQPGNLVRKVLDDEGRDHMSSNIAGHLGKVDGPKEAEITERALRMWFAVDTQLGLDITRKMNLVELGQRLAKEVPQAKEPSAPQPASAKVGGESHRRQAAAAACPAPATR